MYYCLFLFLIDNNLKIKILFRKKNIKIKKSNNIVLI